MPQVIFAFTLNTETKEAAFSGNINPPLALTLLQEIVINQAVSIAKEQENSKPKKDKVKKDA